MNQADDFNKIKEGAASFLNGFNLIFSGSDSLFSHLSEEQKQTPEFKKAQEELENAKAKLNEAIKTFQNNVKL